MISVRQSKESAGLGEAERAGVGTSRPEGLASLPTR